MLTKKQLGVGQNLWIKRCVAAGVILSQMPITE